MNKKSIILGIILIIWMGLIFYMSSSTGEESGGTSEKIIIFLVNKYDKITHASPDTINYHQSEDFVNYANFIFRKICHFGEYFILGVLALSFVISLNKYSSCISFMYSTIFSILYAIIDEYHQTFISGRSGQITDILIDSFGVLCGVVFIFLINRNVKLQKLAKNSSNT